MSRRRALVAQLNAQAEAHRQAVQQRIGAVIVTEDVHFNFVARIEDELVELWCVAKHLVGTSGRPKTVLETEDGNFYQSSEQDSMIFEPSPEQPVAAPAEVLPSHEPQGVSLNAGDSPPASSADPTEASDPDQEVIPASDDATSVAVPTGPGQDPGDVEDTPETQVVEAPALVEESEVQ